MCPTKCTHGCSTVFVVFAVVWQLQLWTEEKGTLLLLFSSSLWYKYSVVPHAECKALLSCISCHIVMSCCHVMLSCDMVMSHCLVGNHWERCRKFLREVPEHIALQAVDEFMATERKNIRKVSAYFMVSITLHVVWLSM